jgi:hypothetical protein
MEVAMNIIPIHDVSFDAAASLAMGEVLNRACMSIRRSQTVAIREIIAKQIIEAVNSNERGSHFLYEQALKALPRRLNGRPRPSS